MGLEVVCVKADARCGHYSFFMYVPRKRCQDVVRSAEAILESVSTTDGLAKKVPTWIHAKGKRDDNLRERNEDVRLRNVLQRLRLSGAQDGNGDQRRPIIKLLYK